MLKRTIVKLRLFFPSSKALPLRKLEESWRMSHVPHPEVEGWGNHRVSASASLSAHLVFRHHRLDCELSPSLHEILSLTLHLSPLPTYVLALKINSLKKGNICTIPRSVPTDNLLIAKGKHAFTMKRPNSHHLHHMIKLSIMDGGTTWYYILLLLCSILSHHLWSHLAKKI